MKSDEVTEIIVSRAKEFYTVQKKTRHIETLPSPCFSLGWTKPDMRRALRNIYPKATIIFRRKSA